MEYNWTLNPECKNKWKFYWLHQTPLHFLLYKEPALVLALCKKAAAVMRLRSCLRDLPRRKSRLWALRMFSATSTEFPGLWFFSPSVQTWKTSSIMIQEYLCPYTWHRCLPYSVMLPLSFLIPTLPCTAWLSLKSSVTHCSFENMEQEGSSADATVLRQILPGSSHILLSVCSLDCPSRKVCKTGN